MITKESEIRAAIKNGYALEVECNGIEMVILPKFLGAQLLKADQLVGGVSIPRVFKLGDLEYIYPPVAPIRSVA